MKINKRCLSAFSQTKPFLALGSKSKLFDTSFSLTSELSLYDYSTDTHYPTLQLDRKFCKLKWCEKNSKSVLATGHDNGMVSLYEPTLEKNSFGLLNSFDGLEGDVLGLDFNTSKNVLAAGSSNGKIIFWNLDKIDQQYVCDIPITGNITSLSWNRKVSRILCASTDDGRILVLDIRAKNIAMTLEYPEIKTVSSVSWHPNCPTSIFASTNLDCLSSFNLSTDSSTAIGNQKSLGFEILNNNLISFSKDLINQIDIDSLKIKSSEIVEGLVEASFSSRDPLCCISTSSGTTTVLGRRDSSLLSLNSQTIFSNYVLSNLDYLVSNYLWNIKYPPLSPTTNNSLSHSIMKIVYKSGRFNLSNSNRKEVGNLLLEDLKQTREGVFDVNDCVIESLIRQDFSTITKGNNVIDLKFILDLLTNKDVENKSPIELLLFAIFKKDFKSLFDCHWKEIVCILLFSDCPIEEVTSIINKLDTKKEGVLLLLNNNPEEFLSTINTTSTPPKSVFGVGEFYSKFLTVVEEIKCLGIKVDNKFIKEFYWYAKDRGVVDKVDVVEKVERDEVVEKVDKVDKDKEKVSFKNTPIKSPPTNSPPIKTNLKPPGIPTPPKVPGFSTRPPVRQSLYSCSSSGSTPTFIKPTEGIPSTYGSQGPKNVIPQSPRVPIPRVPIPSPRVQPIPHSPIPSPRVPPIPHTTRVPSPIPHSPIPSLTPHSPSLTPAQSEINYDLQNLTKEFEQIYENLKEEASKKNNLIIGNKIKDANRRFSVYANLDKQTLTRNVLHKVSLLVQTFKEVSEKNLLKQSVKLIVEDTNDLQENQCNIWIPSIYILVQLVY